MTGRLSSACTTLMVAVLVAVLPAVHAQAPGDFTGEPDQSMAKANESFLKGDLNKSAEHIHTAAVYVRAQGDKVASGAKKAVQTAGDDLDKLGVQVKQGAVKSGDELKKTFAQVDHQLAQAWHATADQARKSGKDSTDALKRAGAGLEGAARWSGTQLKQGAQASVQGVKKVGQGVKLGAEEVGTFFKGIGEGIADTGRQLKSSR